MRTHTLYLEDYDDIVSTKDKMSWGQGERLLLVWPSRGQILNTKLELTLLKRHSQKLSAELGLVVRDRDTKEQALALDIPVFRSMRQAQRMPWQTELSDIDGEEESVNNLDRIYELREKLQQPRKESVLEKRGARYGIFGLGLAAFISLLVLLLPRAEIHIVPETTLQDITLTVRANEDIPSYNLSGALPAEVIQIVVEGRDTIQSSGAIQIPQEPAQGEVLFTNLTENAVSIPEGTLVSAFNEEAPTFVTIKKGKLPDAAGSSIIIEVVASNPGEAGNLPADSLIIIDGDLGLSVAATNPDPTSGGSERQGPAPTAEDYQELREQLIVSIGESALKEIQESLSEGDFMVTKVPIITTILEEEFTPPEPQPANQLSLLLRVEFEIIFIHREELDGMLGGILDRSIPDGYIVKPDSMIINHLNTPVIADGGTAIWEISAQRSIQLDISKEEVINLIKGKSKIAAIQALFNQIDLSREPDISMFPKWWPQIPFLPLRIRVIK